MSEQTTQDKAKRDRSPAYPSITLGNAVDRLIAFDDYSKRHPVPVKNVGNAWGIKPLSSQASSILAALKSYGLVDYQGSGSEMKVVLSEDARTYVRAQQEDIKKQVLRRSALKPKAMGKYFMEWGAVRPPNEVCLDELVLNAKFSHLGAENFLKVYDATIAYAGLSDSDTIGEVDATQTDKDAVIDADTGEDKSETRRKVKKAGVGMRQDVFSIEEGAVTIEWPSTLSTASLQDIDDWLAIVKRKIARSVQKPEAETKDEDQ